MSILHLQQLSLWPRFRTKVKDDLERIPIPVTEIVAPMTPAMSEIQDSVVVVMMALLDELQKTENIDRYVTLK